MTPRASLGWSAAKRPIPTRKKTQAAGTEKSKQKAVGVTQDKLRKKGVLAAITSLLTSTVRAEVQGELTVPNRKAIRGIACEQNERYVNRLPHAAGGCLMPSKGAASAVRIVPLLGSKFSAPSHPPPPNGVQYLGGPLISSVQVYTLFWGAAWQGAQSGLATQLNQFFQFVVTSGLITQLAEYSVPGYPIGFGAFAGSNTITVPAPLAVTSDADIETFVQQHKLAVAHATHPPPPGPVDNHLYFVFTPPGVQVTMGGGASCAQFCGYHNDIGGTTLYAVVPFPNCTGCGGALPTLDAITMFCSHELCEAITDPIPGYGWYGQVGGNPGEIGDFCNQQPKTLGSYTVQKIWSNNAGACV